MRFLVNAASREVRCIFLYAKRVATEVVTLPSHGNVMVTVLSYTPKYLRML